MVKATRSVKALGALRRVEYNAVGLGAGRDQHIAGNGMYPEGRAGRANRMPLVDLAPSPAFEKSIEVSGGYGEKVEDPAKLMGAMERAFKAIEDGQSALLNVVTRAGGR